MNMQNELILALYVTVVLLLIFFSDVSFGVKLILMPLLNVILEFYA